MRSVAGQPVQGGAAVPEAVQDVQRMHESRLRADKGVGRHRQGSCPRRTTTGTVTAAGTALFDQDDRQHAEAVADGV